MNWILNRQKQMQTIWFDAQENSPETQEMIVTKRLIDEDTLEPYQAVVEHSFLRRGFKVQYTPDTGLYELFHINSSTFYKYPTDETIDVFLKKGWLDAVDELQLERHDKQLKMYNRKIENATAERNDSIMVHWRKRRQTLVEKISIIQERMKERNK